MAIITKLLFNNIWTLLLITFARIAFNRIESFFINISEINNFKFQIQITPLNFISKATIIIFFNNNNLDSSSLFKFLLQQCIQRSSFTLIVVISLKFLRFSAHIVSERQTQMLEFCECSVYPAPVPFGVSRQCFVNRDREDVVRDEFLNQ